MNVINKVSILIDQHEDEDFRPIFQVLETWQYTDGGTTVRCALHRTIEAAREDAKWRLANTPANEIGLRDEVAMSHV